ncbi:hypothetical protein LZK75_28360 (plasmid) [Rhizobium leguminosarum]|nr:hypothetical protein LZK75_28360 [Rhizobium leguminosarum]
MEHVEAGRIVAQLDSRGGDSVSIPADSYVAINHGYATTIQKNQGAMSIAPMCGVHYHGPAPHPFKARNGSTMLFLQPLPQAPS